MSDTLLQLALFASKTLIVFVFILLVLLAIIVIRMAAKDKSRGKLSIKNINQEFSHITEALLAETLPKKLYKKIVKERCALEKAKAKSDEQPNNVFLINFDGDLKATAVNSLREEITAILQVATPKDEVIIRLESGGGVVHGYGLGAAQLMRLRAKNIPLTVTIDKIAASGGYLMACVANKILAAPFAIIGSIGVIVQLPNFHRFLKNHDVDFEQQTAGDFKRTISLFGENTKEGRQKLQQEIEDIHRIFKNLISDHRKQIDINKVATGEHWLGKEALELQLVDVIQTSDEYILDRSKEANLYEVRYETKKSFFGKLAETSSFAWEKLSAFRVFR